LPPEIGIARPAVNENERVFAFADVVVMNLDALQVGEFAFQIRLFALRQNRNGGETQNQREKPQKI
jgi:hypothetical protein